MLAQRKYEQTEPPAIVKKRRRRVSAFALVFKNPMVCVLVMAFVACLTATMYVSAYSGCNAKGCSRAKLAVELSRLKKENERLRLDLIVLSEPEVIEKFANEHNMMQRQETAYLAPIEGQPQNTASIDIR